MKLKLTVVVDYVERSTHPKDLEKLLLQAVPRAKEEGWLTTMHDARVKEISCKVDVLPEALVGEWEPPTPIAASSLGEREMPWCEACGSYHIKPRSRGEWLMLRCFAPFDGEVNLRARACPVNGNADASPETSALCGHLAYNTRQST